MALSAACFTCTPTPPKLRTTPAAAAWVGCTVALLAGELSRALALKLRAAAAPKGKKTPD
ncbi:MAG: hypothetical protein HEQ38_01700 [Gemmatimonas sp.]|nr:hypothetical protein [Gemmatimonas sp.]